MKTHSPIDVYKRQDANNKDSAATKLIGCRAADEQKCRQAKGVSIDQPLNHHKRSREIPFDGRQRNIDDSSSI